MVNYPLPLRIIEVVKMLDSALGITDVTTRCDPSSLEN